VCGCRTPRSPNTHTPSSTNADATLATQGNHAWTVNGTQYVRCVVTDMKGHTATATAVVTVTGGTAAPLTITGTVKDENGNPLAGATVNNFKATAPNPIGYGDAGFVGSSETGADGRYLIALPAGSTTFTLTARHGGYTFTCTSANGVVPVAAASVANVNFTRVRKSCTVSGSVIVAGKGYDPAVYGDLWISDGTQNVKVSAGGWQMTVPDGSVLALTATPDNPTYTVAAAFPNPYRVVDDFNLLHFTVKVPGAMPGVGFASSGATTNDLVGTVDIPITMTPPAGATTWGADQAINYWIDESSTASYGVDYKMTGGTVTFTHDVVPTPYLIPLKIIPTGVPGTRTVVIRIGRASSITTLSPTTTFTYTISN
jgi:hypothetical protein